MGWMWGLILGILGVGEEEMSALKMPAFVLRIHAGLNPPAERKDGPKVRGFSVFGGLGSPVQKEASTA